MSMTSIRSPVTVAVDVLGTDIGPEPMCRGVRESLEADDALSCIVVASRQAIREHFPEGESARLAFCEAGSFISMSDNPHHAVRAKRDASTLLGMELVRRGAADALVTGANTGAVMLSSAAILRRSAGVLHPALGTIVSSRFTEPCILVDCGASTRREPAWLVQFGVMGAAMAKAMLGISRPSVGILANGIESIKGDTVIRSANELFCRMPISYVGLVEPFSIFTPEPTVVVTDGLIGNLVLKTIEGATKSLISPLIAATNEAGTKSLTDSSWDGDTIRNLGWGAVVLGVDGTVVKTHGTGTARHCRNAIKLASAASRLSLLPTLRESLASAHAEDGPRPAAPDAPS